MVIKPAYVQLLPQLAGSIGLDWFSSEDVISDTASAEVLSGFMAANGYRYVRPVDRGVTVNRKFLRLMSGVEIPRNLDRRRMVRSIYRTGRRLAPDRLRAVVPRSWRLRVAKYHRP